MSDSIDLEYAPGHLIRRAQQVSVAVFMEAAGEFDVTPVQFAFLNALVDHPGVDQVTLAGLVSFDAATSGAVIARLEAKGWLRREPDPQDKRRKLIALTPEGSEAARRLGPIVQASQVRIVDSLLPTEREQLVALLRKLVVAYEAMHRH